MAVRLVTTGQQVRVGVAYGDSTLRRLTICEFQDDSTFSDFEALVMQVRLYGFLLTSFVG